MRVKILGGAGFVGYHLAKLLHHQGANVVVLGRNPPSVDNKVEGVKYVQGDCASPQVLNRLIGKEDYVVFLAYNSVPKTSFENPLRDIQENLPLALNVLNRVREVPIRKLLYVSSGGTVYGPTAIEAPLSEDCPTNPISPYGITKLAIEKYCQMYARMFGTAVVIARPSNPFGPRQIPYRGQGFVATAIAKVLSGEEVTVFGETGTVRDYLYIDDLVAALSRLLISDTSPGAVYNIGSGRGMNNRAVLQLIANVGGLNQSDIKIHTESQRHFDVPYNVLDSSKMVGLGWEPDASPEGGMAATMSWVSSYLSAA